MRYMPWKGIDSSADLDSGDLPLDYPLACGLILVDILVYITDIRHCYNAADCLVHQIWIA